MADLNAGILIKSRADLSGIDKAKQGLHDFAKSSADASKKFALGLAGMAAGAIAFGVKAIHSYQQADQAQKRLEQGLKNLGGAQSKHIQALNDQALALQKTTRFSDDYTTQAQSQLTTFKLTADQIQKLTPHMLDLAEGTRKLTGEAIDANQAANLLGKALDQGSVGPLKKFGVSVDDNTEKLFKNADKAERVAIITKIMDDNFKGFATAGGKTAAGQMDILANNIDNIMEGIGKFLNDAMAPLLGKLNDWASSMADQIQPRLENIKTWFQENPEKVAKGVAIISGAFSFSLVPAIVEAALEFGEFFLALLPFLVIGALVGLAIWAITDYFKKHNDKLEEAKNKYKELKEIWEKDIEPRLLRIWGIIKHNFIIAWEQLKDALHLDKWDLLKGLLIVIGTILLAIPAGIIIAATAFSAIARAIGTVINNIQTAIDKINEFIARLSSVGNGPQVTLSHDKKINVYSGGKDVTSDYAQAYGKVQKDKKNQATGNTFGKAAIGKAVGGLVRGGETYRTHEGEMFTPGTDGRITPAGGGGMTVYQFNEINQLSDMSAAMRELAFLLR